MPPMQPAYQPISYSPGLAGTLPVGEGGLDIAAYPAAQASYDMSHWGNAASTSINQAGLVNASAGNLASLQSGGFGAPQQGWMGKAGSWLSNGQNLGTVVQGLGTLTNAYLGFRQLSMAKDQLKFNKESWAKNFANSQKTYNTSLEDRINGRTSAYEGKDADVQAYLAKHKLGG